MSTLEEKKIVIKLPHLRFRSLLTFRFFLVAFSLLLISSFTYWYQVVRPYFWISSAHLEAFSAVINSDASGRIAEMGPLEGEWVKKGQTLFSLDRDLIIAKQKKTKSTLDALNEQIETEKGQIGKAMEGYLAATSDFEIEKQLALMEEAQKKGEMVHSQLAAAKTELELIDLQMKKMTLAAPFDGVILKKSKNPGAAVSAGDPIYALCDPDRLWIEAEIPEKQIGLVAIGTPALIRVAAYPKKNLTGKVFWIGPATVAKSALLPFSGQKEAVPIKISIENPDRSLKPGLSAAVRLKIH